MTITNTKFNIPHFVASIATIGIVIWFSFDPTIIIGMSLLLTIFYLVLFYGLTWATAMFFMATIEERVEQAKSIEFYKGHSHELRTENQKLKTNIEEYKNVLSHLGYTLHHLGNDIVNGESGIVNSNDPDYKEIQGTNISNVGEYFRFISSKIPSRPYNDKTMQEVAQIFYTSIDDKNENIVK